jgi:hypothetical protein
MSHSNFNGYFVPLLLFSTIIIFLPIDGGAPLVTKELDLRLMSEIGLLGVCSYCVAVEQRVDIVEVLTIPDPWIVYRVRRAAYCHCAKLNKRKMADSRMRTAVNRL